MTKPAKLVNPGGLPYGLGSMQLRGRVWWLIYRDTNGNSVQENTRTTDVHEARIMLTDRTIASLEARLAVVKAARDEAKRDLRFRKANPDNDEGSGRAGQRGARGGGAA